MGPILIIVFAVIILLAIGAYMRRNGRSRSSTSDGDFKAWVDPGGPVDHSHPVHHGHDAGGHSGGHGGSHH